MKIKGLEVSDENMHLQVVEGEALAILTSKTGAWRSIRPIMTEGSAPCAVACPSEIKVRDYLQLLLQGNLKEAWRLLKEDNPFPSITGRVCPAFCENDCNRRDFDESVAIKAIERLLGDYGTSQGFSIPRMPAKAEKIAIIGSGPAGLSSAYYLAIQGYPVTIFESQPMAGGMLYWGIPKYRLPKSVLKGEIDGLIGMNIEIMTGVTIGRDITLEDLRTNGYKAVLIAAGAWKDHKLNIPGEDANGVSPGVEFLRLANAGTDVKVGDRVFVVGGGNAAIDSARMSLRLRAKNVTIMYRRTRAEMPAIAEEVESALEEGIKIEFLATPVEILVRNGKVNGMKCVRMELGESDDSGRRSPVPISGSEFDVESDTVIVAISQVPELSFLSNSGININTEGTVSVDTDTMATNLPQVFAAGDVQTGPSTVAQAIGLGRRAAASINYFLTGVHIEANANAGPVIRFADLNTAYFKSESRKVSQESESQTLDNEGIAEAKRCFGCGKCNACNMCWFLCPDGAVLEASGQIQFDYDYCKGCGVCAEECPRQAVMMEEESKWQ